MKREPDWIVIGGGYSGALSAWFQSKYPNYATGAWASSAMINAILDYKELDTHVYKATKEANMLCDSYIASVIDEVNTYVASGGDSLEYICGKFDVKVEDFDEKDF